MPSFFPVMMTLLTWWPFDSRIMVRTAGVPTRTSIAATRALPSLRRTSCCEQMPTSTSESATRTADC